MYWKTYNKVNLVEVNLKFNANISKQRLHAKSKKEKNFKN